MAMLAALGEKLYDLDELDEVVLSKKEAIQEYIDDPKGQPRFSVSEGDVQIGHVELAKAVEAKSSAVPYQGIGFGKPLTITVESVYVGDYPDAVRFTPWAERGDVLVTSAWKPFERFQAAARAVHLLQENAARRSYPKVTATSQGTRLAFYSPAVTEMSIFFSVELTVDRDFSSEVGDALAKAMTGAGALPVFAPVAPYLVAGAVLVPIGMNVAKMLARPRPFFAEDVEVNFTRPGLDVAQTGAYVLYPGGDKKPFAGYDKLRGCVLRDSNGTPYGGELPYVVISLDGTPREKLEGWAATAASALLLERFFAQDALMAEALDVVTSGLVYANDMTYRQKAVEALEKSKTLKGPKKKEQEELYKAYVKNIQTKELRDTVA